MTVKVPVSLPYQTNWTTPQSVEGKLQVGHEFYEMVEQIMLNDTIYITCKPDRDARANFYALAEHINKHINDNAGDGPKPSKSIVIQLLKEYISFQRLHSFFYNRRPFRLHPVPTSTLFAAFPRLWHPFSSSRSSLIF